MKEWLCAAIGVIGGVYCVAFWRLERGTDHSCDIHGS